MAEARSLDLLRHRISRLQPAPVRQLELHGELLAAAWERAWPRQLPAPVTLFLLPRCALPREVPAFWVASVFPPLLAPLWLSQFSWIFVRFLSRPISFSQLSVLVWACDAALISVKRSAPASRAASAMALFPPRARICSLSLVPWRLLLLPRDWEISLALGTTESGNRFARSRCVGFVANHQPGREGDP